MSQQTSQQVRKGRFINWYRCPIDRDLLKQLSQRSDFKGLVQSLGYLGIVAATAALSIYSFHHWPWWATVAALFLHGTVFSFMINAVHELTHNTVFRSKWLNVGFARLFAFLGVINHEMFQTSHSRHHAYTLHPPDDQEVVLPIPLMIRHFFLHSFINIKQIFIGYGEILRIALGRFTTPWEQALYPESAPEKRRVPVRWARLLLGGHVLILAVSLYMGWWIVPVVITLAPFYGNSLFFLCNNTQHIGLQDNVPDFRLCCRTFVPNPLIRFLYWQMNYHIEHHMYPTVPCYNLGRLHKAIKSDLPYCFPSLYSMWREICGILKKQTENPAYQHVVELPPPQPKTAAAAPAVVSPAPVGI